MFKRVGFRKWFILVTIALVIMLIGSVAFFAFSHNFLSSAVTKADLKIAETQFHPANYKQFASYINLGIYDGTLFMWNPRSSKLLRFIDGGFQTICTIDGAGVGFLYDCFYYEAEIKQEKYTYSICCYHLVKGEHTKLATIELGRVRDWHFMEDGKVFAPVDWDRSSYVEIKNAQFAEEVEHPETYNVGGRAYFLEGAAEQATLMRYDTDGSLYSYEAEIPYGEKSLIPCENGLLIHNETNGDFLFFVEAGSGNVVELFTVDCLYAQSAVNVHNGYAYLSFVRYTEMGPLNLGGKRDENDELNGTYRISLLDYSVEKISDEIYNGLFIFDDTGIYACNEDNNIYKLDFEGQRILTILE